jgi:CHAD domain-containing protein
MDTNQRRTKLLFSKIIRISKDMRRNPAPEQVHQFRTTLRRIESAIAPAAAVLTSKDEKLLTDLKRIRKSAGRLRDIDVQLEALSSLTIDRGFDQKKQLQQALERKRRRRAAKLENSLKDFSGSLPKVARLATKVAEAHSDKGHGEVDFYRLAMDQWSHAAVKYELNTKRDFSPDTLHGLRLDLKRVRYTAEMGIQDGNKRLIAQAKRIQDAIGQWRDLATLSETAEKVLNNYQNSSLVSLLKNLSGAKQVAAVRTSIDVTNEMLQPDPPKKSPESVQLGHRDKKTS